MAAMNPAVKDSLYRRAVDTFGSPEGLLLVIGTVGGVSVIGMTLSIMLYGTATSNFNRDFPVALQHARSMPVNSFCDGQGHVVNGGEFPCVQDAGFVVVHGKDLSVFEDGVEIIVEQNGKTMTDVDEWERQNGRYAPFGRFISVFARE